MNLRQKNKKLKQELEFLKKQAIKPTITYQRTNVVRLRSVRKYSPVEIENVPDDFIKRDAIRPLVEEILPHVNFDSYTDYATGSIAVEASLDVVVRKD